MNNFFVSLTLNQLLLSNVHLGDYKKFFNSKIKPYILGEISKIHILNLSYTLVQLKLLSKIIINTVALNQRILVIKGIDSYHLDNIFISFPNIFYYNKEWIGGGLTNYKRVRLNKKFQNTNIEVGTHLYNLRYMPSLVFFFDVNFSKFAFREAWNLEIPISAIVNNNTRGFKHIDYPIMGNNKSFESLFLYFNFLRNSIVIGFQKQRLKILRIL